jgi:hypothetical protein
MKAGKSLEWQRLYAGVLSESDSEKLPEAIARAEAAIQSREKQLTQGPEHEAERRAIADARAALHIVKIKHLPGWK